MHWSPLGWVRTHFKCVAFGRCAAETKKEYINIKKKKNQTKYLRGTEMTRWWEHPPPTALAWVRSSDLTSHVDRAHPRGFFRFSSIHKINMQNSTRAFDKITYWLVLFYRVSFLAFWLTLTSAQNDLTGATTRAYSNQDTKCNHTLRDKAVTLTSGLFLHRRHHQDYK